MSLEVPSCRGLRPECGKVDRDLWLWFCNARDQFENSGGPRVTKRMVQEKAKQVFQEAGIIGFKASDGWYVRWIKRWHRLGSAPSGEIPNKRSKSKAKPKKSQKAVRREGGTPAVLTAEKYIGDTGRYHYESNVEDFLHPIANPGFVDKMQILHDVASRELSEPILQLDNLMGNRSNPPLDIGSQSINEHHPDGTVALDFDNITWNDLPYLDRPEYNNGMDEPAVVYSDNGHNSNYSSTVMSQMMEFAEICHMKENEMQSQIQNQLINEGIQHTSEQGLHKEQNNIQQPSIVYQNENANFDSNEILEHTHGVKSFISSANGLLPDTMFYSLGDESFSILDHNPSAVEHGSVSIVLGDTYQADSGHINGVSGFGMKVAEITCPVDARHDLSNMFPSSISDYILPNNALTGTVPNALDLCSTDSVLDTASSFNASTEVDITNGDSSMLLFTQSPFSFADDSMSGLMRLPSSSSLPGDTLCKDIEEVSSSYFRIMEGIVQDHVEVHPTQKDKTKMIKDKTPKKSKIITEEAVVCKSDDRQMRRLGGERYLPYFKERVLAHAAQHTARDAAKHFNVHVDTVTLWARSKQLNSSAPKLSPDQQLLSWLKHKRNCGVMLTRSQVQEKAKQLLETQSNMQKDRTRWFYIWALRFAEESEKQKDTKQPEDSEKSHSTVTSKCSQVSKALYPDEFKQEVVLFAQKASQNLAASVFNIARKRVFDWIGASKKTNTPKEGSKVEDGENQLLGQGENRLQVGGQSKPVDIHADSVVHTSGSGNIQPKPNNKGFGRAVTSVAVDRELWDWFCEQTAKRNKPKSSEIRAKAVELFRAHNFHKISCSHGWFKRWSVRHGIALRYEGDSDLIAWCLEQFDHNRNISHRDLLNHAYHVLTGTHKSDFKASAGWALRFCKRNHLLLSTRPQIDMDLPASLKRQVAQFRLKVQMLVHSPGMKLKNVGTMDEIPLNFTAGGSTGSRGRNLLRRSGLENCHATVILSSTADGNLLPPSIIFKGEESIEQIIVEGVPLLVMQQPESKMNSTTMLQWLDHVWKKNVSSTSTLILDCYEPHTTEEVKESCQDTNCHLAVIPPGCSSKLQPQDLAVTRQLESIIFNHWGKHFAALDNFGLTKPTPYSNNADVIKWIAEAYLKLKASRKDAIRLSFLVTGLTVAPDHSEDHFIENSASIPA